MLAETTKLTVPKRLTEAAELAKSVRLARLAELANKRPKIAALAKFGFSYFLDLQIFYLHLGEG